MDRAPPLERGTKHRALVAARGLLQTQGYNGFSFQHLADSLGIKKPSLFAHFASKEALGNYLIDDYRRSFTRWTETVAELGAPSQIMGYFDIFLRLSRAGTMYCPVSTLSAELSTLPQSMKKRLKSLFTFQFAWLEDTIAKGQKEGDFRKDLACNELAQFIVSLGIGGQFLGRITNDAEKIKVIKKLALRFLGR